MTTPNPNGAGGGGPDMSRVAQRAAQNAASSVGDMAIVAAIAQENLDTYVGRCTRLEAQIEAMAADHEQIVRDKDAELARARATITALESAAAEVDDVAAPDAATADGVAGDPPADATGD